MGFVIQFKEDGTYFKSYKIIRARDGTFQYYRTRWTNDPYKARIYHSYKTAHNAVLQYGMGVRNTKVIELKGDE